MRPFRRLVSADRPFSQREGAVWYLELQIFRTLGHANCLQSIAVPAVIDGREHDQIQAWASGRDCHVANRSAVTRLPRLAFLPR
jgi:hypothetical protein